MRTPTSQEKADKLISKMRGPFYEIDEAQKEAVGKKVPDFRLEKHSKMQDILMGIQNNRRRGF